MLWKHSKTWIHRTTYSDFLLVPDHLIKCFLSFCGEKGFLEISSVLTLANTMNSSKTHSGNAGGHIKKQLESKKCASILVQTTRGPFVRLPTICPSGKNAKQTVWKSEEFEYSVMMFQVERCHAGRYHRRREPPSIALAKGTDILMEITSFCPLPGPVNTIASC